MKSKTSIIIAIIIVTALGYWYWSGTSSVPFPALAPVETADTTNAIDADIQSIDIGDMDGDLNAIDADINAL